MNPTTRQHAQSPELRGSWASPGGCSLHELLARHHVAGPAAPAAHLVGIGGAGMRALAEVMADRGWTVSGSDLVVPADWGPRAGVRRVFPGHSAAHLPERLDVLVHTAAVNSGNPEVSAASRRGVPAVTYFEAVGLLAAGRRTLAVAGTHGKSTTTAMLAHVMAADGREPTVFCGAAPRGAGSGGMAGGDGPVVVEACEYRRHFLMLTPSQAAILNVEPDHFDCFPSVAELESAFCAFAARLPRDGRLLIPGGCPRVRRMAASAPCRVETFAVGAKADWQGRVLGVCGGRHRFRLVYGGEALTEVVLPLPGRHNAENALATAAIAWHEGVSPARIADSLASFPGLRRRLEPVGVWRGVTIVDDYAHLPGEIRCALSAVRAMYPGRRLWCLFQPHQALRTARLLDELADSLSNADKVLLAEVFRAREPPARSGDVRGADLAARLRAVGREVPAVHEIPEILGGLEGWLCRGDVLLILGAGDVGKVADEFRQRIREDRAAG